ncbi:MAG: InlB B-repeat-containing protein [Eubacteriales bacterium]
MKEKMQKLVLGMLSLGLVFSQNEVVHGASTPVEVATLSTVCASCKHDHSTGTEISSNGSITHSISGTRLYFLSKDIQGDLSFTGTSAASDKVTLCLNDYTLTGTGSGAVISLMNVTFDLFGGANEQGVITGGIGKEFSGIRFGGGIYATGSNITMNSGTISGNSSANKGGGIYLAGNSQFQMDGGLITDNESNDGGGIYATSAEIIINNGTISNNEATKNGGGIGSDNTEITLNGGLFTGNKASSGGGIYTFANKLTATGGTIQENEAVSGGGFYVDTCFASITNAVIHKNTATTGGGIYVNNTSTLNVNDGTTLDNTTISENTATDCGGGILAYKGKLTLTNSEISGNTAATVGGGLYLYTNSTMTMEDSLISDNEASDGGGISTSTSEITLTNSEVLGNSATSKGGGLHLYTNSTMTMEDSLISGNEATEGGGVRTNASEITLTNSEILGNSANNGGGFYVGDNSTFTMSGGLIEQNTASVDGGGGTVVNYSNFEMTDGAISENTATSNGGGIVVYSSSTATISGGKISENTANVNGGGIAASQGTITITGGLISENKAPNGNGGGIHLVTSNASMSGGEISGNESKTGAGVYVNNGTFTMSGGTTKNNVASSTGNGVYLYGDGILVLDGKVAVAEEVYISNFKDNYITPKANYSNTASPIVVTMETPGQFTTGAATGHQGNFISGNTDYYVEYVNGTNTDLKLTKSSPVYDIDSATPVNGSFVVTVDGSTVSQTASGNTVTVRPKADAGYGVHQVTYNGNVASKSGSGYTFTMPSADVEVIVTFKELYQIDVETKNGSVTPSATSAIEDTVITLSITPDTGYKLDSVTVEADNLGTSVSYADSKFTMPNDDVTVTVTFKKLYQIDVVTINGTVTPSTTSATEGTDITLSITPDTGYKLDSVTVEADNLGTSVSYADSKFTMPNDDVTVTVTFVEDTTPAPTPTPTGSINLVYHDGSTADGTLTINATTGGTLQDTLPTPSRTGYTFDGWFTAETGGRKITSTSTFDDGDSIHAQWTVNSYTVYVTASGEGSVTIDKDYVYFGDLITIKPEPVTGSEIQSVTVKDNSGNDITVTNLQFTMPASNVTVDVIFKTTGAAPYTISFNSMDGNSVSDLFTGTDGKLTSVPSCIRTGYTFNGWYTSSTGGTKITTSHVFTADTTVYAQWTLNSSSVVNYIVYFDANGGNAVSSMLTGDKGTLSYLPVPTRSGYTFTGWYATSTGGTQITTSSVFTQNTIVFALWTANSSSSSKVYTVSFNANGGSSVNDRETGTNATLASLPSSSRNGYTFYGWYTALSGGSRISTTTVFSNDTTVYARGVLEETYTNTDDLISTGLLYLPVPNFMANGLFHDVNDSSLWYYQGVRFIYERGLLTETGRNQFSPEAFVTRGEIIQILYNIAGRPQIFTYTNYPNVSTSIYFANATFWTEAMGMIDGSSFSPNDYVTMEELLMMIHAFEKGLVGETYYGAAEAVSWARANKITSGLPSDYSIYSTVTRAELSQALMNFLVRHIYY